MRLGYYSNIHKDQKRKVLETIFKQTEQLSHVLGL